MTTPSIQPTLYHKYYPHPHQAQTSCPGSPRNAGRALGEREEKHEEDEHITAAGDQYLAKFLMKSTERMEGEDRAESRSANRRQQRD